MIKGLTDIEAAWPHVRESIEKALNGEGKYGVEHFKQMLLEKRCQLWIVRAEEDSSCGVVITQIVTFPHKRVCFMPICTGTGREKWQHHLTEIEDWARSEGCASMELIARPGWQRILKGKGYEMTHITLEKDL